MADCAQVFFELLRELDLLWLRDKISLLPNKTVWESLARRTAREEFNSVCSHLALTTLQGQKGGVKDKINSWLIKFEKSIARYRKLLAMVHTGDLIELEKITVLLKELRSLCIYS